MIPCVCIDDSFRPNDIPTNKWVKKGNTYHVINTTTVLPQGELAVMLDEIDLAECCLPYKFFLASRFRFKEEDLPRLMNMMFNKQEHSPQKLETIDEDLFV